MKIKNDSKIIAILDLGKGCQAQIFWHNGKVIARVGEMRFKLIECSLIDAPYKIWWEFNRFKGFKFVS
jgi:hypothetical protein